MELVSDREARTPAIEQTALTVYRAFQLGLVIYYVGLNSNVLEFTPPLNLSEDEALRGITILDQALSDVEAGRVDPQLLERFAGW